MSEKNRDDKNRWRNVTIAFRMVERHIQNQRADFQVKQREEQKKLDDTIAENEKREREGVELQLRNSSLKTEYYQTVNKLENKKDEIYFAEQEVDKWKQVLDVAKWEQEQAQYELVEAKRLKKELLEAADGDYYLKEQVIALRYQNQMLQEENKSLRDKLEKAYEFMKQFVIGGVNLLEKFKEWIGEKVKDVVRGR